MGKSFKENLKELLEYHDMTMKELAYRAGISHRSIENYLNSRESIPPADYACKIAKVLNTTVEYLITGRDTNYEKPKFSKEILSIINSYEHLTDNDQKLIENLVSSLSQKNTIRT